MWSDTASDFEKESVISINATNANDSDDVGINIKKLGRGSNGRPAPICLPPDHEYHEISDEENARRSYTDTDLEEFGSVESPRFEVIAYFIFLLINFLVNWKLNFKICDYNKVMFLFTLNLCENIFWSYVEH